MSAVKIGVSRQVVIPKKIHEKLGLAPGDYLEVELKDGKVVFTPKTLVDRALETALDEALADVKAGRVSKPFRSAKALVRDLKRRPHRARAKN